jgi:hypothetical protein
MNEIFEHKIAKKVCGLVLDSLSRVTRLCEFSPIGRLFSFVQFYESSISPKFGQLFQGKSYTINFGKKMWLGDIFTNSSVHPVSFSPSFTSEHFHSSAMTAG